MVSFKVPHYQNANKPFGTKYTVDYRQIIQ